MTEILSAERHCWVAAFNLDIFGSGLKIKAIVEADILQQALYLVIAILPPLQNAEEEINFSERKP